MKYVALQFIALCSACSGEYYGLMLPEGGPETAPSAAPSVVVIIEPPTAQPLASQEGGTAMEAAITVDAGAPEATVDASALETSTPEASIDAGIDSPPDAPAEATLEASTDAPPDAPPPTCNPVLPQVSAICNGYGTAVPTGYCLSTPNSAYNGGMPRECQCASTYNCACLMANLAQKPDPNPCDGLASTGYTTFVSCADSMQTVSGAGTTLTPQVTVTCK